MEHGSLERLIALLQEVLHPAVSLVRFDENGLVAIEKPAAVMSHPNGDGDVRHSVVRAPYDARGRHFSIKNQGETIPIFLINRIDSATQGLLLLALQSSTALSVRESFRRQEVRKTYHAICKAHSMPRSGSEHWRDFTHEERRGEIIRVQRGGPVEMSTKVEYGSDFSLGQLRCSPLHLYPLTGRTHQLRFQCALHGFPIAGDKTYGDFQFNGSFRKATANGNLQLLSAKIALSYSLHGKEFHFCATSPSVPQFLCAAKSAAQERNSLKPGS